MRDEIPSQPLRDEDSDPPHYASFILRCWTNDAGRVRARLLDVRSGLSRPIADLADLPGLVRSLMGSTPPD